jgi:hypothetical protein
MKNRAESTAFFEDEILFFIYLHNTKLLENDIKIGFGYHWNIRVSCTLSFFLRE